MTFRILTIIGTAGFILLPFAASSGAGLSDAETKELVQHRYGACLQHASYTFTQMWESACDELCSQKNPLEYCMRFHNSSNTVTCSPPLSVTDKLDKQLERDKDRCLREFQAGVTEMTFD